MAHIDKINIFAYIAKIGKLALMRLSPLNGVRFNLRLWKL